MRSLLSIFLLLGLTLSLHGQSPHGADFNTNCIACHTSDSWEISFDSWNFTPTTTPIISQITGLPLELPKDTLRFNHFNTAFPLIGQHASVDCRLCHETLVFSEANTTCVSCHIDIHNQTVGSECIRCHDTESWLVDNIVELHQQNGFPLLGVHASAACVDCHTAGSQLQFDRIGNDCINCHLTDFNATTNPNHAELGLSTDCISCHAFDEEWSPATFDNHDEYYVLNGAHAAIAKDCAACHIDGNFSTTPNTCVGCHEQDYTNAVDPNHTVLQFSTDCTTCHTETEWVPATFDHDGLYFPINSGKHEGTWSDCIDCHTNPSNYAEFTCTTCHANPETENQHAGVEGYIFESNACLACHPAGDAAEVFDHNLTNFPLTGAHITTDCIDCHGNGYQNTPTDCASCHQMDFTNTTNPNHTALSLSTDCVSCHTTEVGWTPASFDNHDDFYELKGAHAVIKNDCASCHNGDYSNTPTTCAGCHTQDFNQTTEPNHKAALFPMDCTTCHTETAWAPSTFDHNESYPLTGAHAIIADDCVACHQGDYDNTPTTCVGCHQQDYNESINPNHNLLNLSTDCASCHTTQLDWMPAAFDIHDDFYPLNGAHAAIKNDCAACHNGDYTNTPTTCFGCHEQDYTNTVDPNHATLQFSTDCTTCHTESEWLPTTFDHDGLYFPIYSGAHQGEWNDCIECHTNPSNYAEFTCTTCHANPETENQHIGVNGYVHLSTACLVCHPTGNADDVFDHNLTNFPLTGAHITVDCNSCHTNGYAGTPMDCASCHTNDFNQTINPNHSALNLSTDCVSCHTTEAGWSPASFAIHDDFYELKGAHAAIANDCASCHNGDYANTPNTCNGCHAADYNQTTDPNHAEAKFPIDCQSCHSETAWTPSSFNHNDFYVLDGAHATIADDCVACHNGDYDNTPNTCVGCHQMDFSNTTNPNHTALGLSTDCATCHTTQPDWKPAKFDIHDTYYALNGAHAAIKNDCASCHNGDYNNTPNTCNGCHAADYAATTIPNHAAAKLPIDCQSCHSETAWEPATFNHSDFYVLDGAHAAIANDCASCHIDGNYTTTPNTCVGCHQMDFSNTTNPNHTALNLSTDCTTCHTTQPDWAPARFDIHDNYYALNGAHATIKNDCASCHNGDYNNTPNTCNGCHAADYTNTTNPNHAAAKFPTDCTTCHSESAWTPSSFNHDNFYPLREAHAAIKNDCAACHIDGNFSTTPNTCVGCHQQDYSNTTEPNHTVARLSTDCQSCHSETAWEPATFNHSDFYVLDGAHAAIKNDCASCHIDGNYTTTPNTCVGCHQMDFSNTTNPNHTALGLSTDCVSCHTTQPDWAPARFDIHDNYYALNGAHAIIKNDCASCHNGDYNNTPNTCNGCHAADYTNTTNPNHAAAKFPTDCTTCHSESAWTPSSFNHDNFYPLREAHAAIKNDCAACHIDGNFSTTPNTCVGCHQQDYSNTTEPNHTVARLSTDCQSCHSETAWEPATFNHSDFYVLDGAHAAIKNDCASCHIDGNYTTTPNTCVGCHQMDFSNTTNPNHTALGLSTDCVSCHTTQPDWAPARFDIHDNYYALNGAHATIKNDCASCHNGDYNNTPNTCNGCHAADYANTNNPNHAAAKFPTDCTTCHSESAWTPSSFNHDNFYPLREAHAAIKNDCAACHIDGNFSTTPNTCVGCHQQDYSNTTEPNHTLARLSTDCQSCHSETAWEPATFNHSDFYVLDGAHAAIANDCASCHIDGNYTTTPNTCVGCHQMDFSNTTNPNHRSLNLSTNCATCHTTQPDWMPARFDNHNSYYALNGAHATIRNDCAACHNGDYNNTPNTCNGCHAADYANTNNPNHAAAKFPTDCTTCHSETAWEPSSFDHNDFYVLRGAHATIKNDCAACHINGNYSTTPTTCNGCHATDYANTNNPNHAAANFPTDCTTCHSETAWEPSSFDHNDFYVLRGAHATIKNDCAACHINGNYSTTPTTCNGCHAADYANTNNPNHAAANFPTDCTTCHSETAWEPSSFDHNDFYVLRGAHATIKNDCAACHQGDYNNTPNTCNGCHISDYNQTMNPNHAAANFPTACESCHTETAWEPASFNHDDFYVLRGAHANIRNDCAECHINGNYNNTPTTCNGCHADDYANTNNPNHASANFPTTCESCHTETAWEPASFNHDDFYVLRGAHANIRNDCAKCHANGNYNNTPNTCNGCHASDYANTNNPNHAQAGFPITCENCHSETAWEPATFDHDSQYFPIYSGNHRGEWDQCTDCHTTGNYSTFSCIDCHEHNNANELADDHDGVNGYSYSSPACYSCHPTGDEDDADGGGDDDDD